MFGRIIFTAAIFLTCAAFAQSTGLNLSGETHDRSLPVDIQADSLSVNQETQTAQFTGNAVVSQGGLTLAADEITVIYSEDGSEIASVDAKGNVAFSNTLEKASSDAATYQVDSGDLTMTGSVLLIQGVSEISGNRLQVNILTNVAEMSGNVRTRLVPR